MPRPVPVLRVIENPKYVDVMTLLDECNRWLYLKGVNSRRYQKARQKLAERAQFEMSFDGRRSEIHLVHSRNR